MEMIIIVAYIEGWLYLKGIDLYYRSRVLIDNYGGRLTTKCQDRILANRRSDVVKHSIAFKYVTLIKNSIPVILLCLTLLLDDVCSL